MHICSISALQTHLLSACKLRTTSVSFPRWRLLIAAFSCLWTGDVWIQDALHTGFSCKMRLQSRCLRSFVNLSLNWMDKPRPWLATPVLASAADAFAVQVAPWGIVGCSDHAVAIAHFSTSVNADARRPRPADSATATAALLGALDTNDPRAVNRALKDCFKVASSDEEAVACIKEALTSRPLPDPVPSLLLACALAGQAEGGGPGAGGKESTGLAYPVQHVVRALRDSCTLSIQHAVHALAVLPLLSYAGWKECVSVFRLSPLTVHPSTPWPILADEHRVAFLHTLVRRGWVKDAAAYASTVEGRAVLRCVDSSDGSGGGAEEERAVAQLVYQHCMVEKRREAQWKGGRSTGVALVSRYREGEDAHRGFMVAPDPSITSFPVRLLLAALMCRGHVSYAMTVVGKEEGPMQVEMVKAALAGCGQGCNPQLSTSPATACSGSIKLAARLCKGYGLDHTTLFPGLYEATIRLAVSGLLWRKDGFPVDVMAGGMWEDSDVGRIMRASLYEWADRRAGTGGSTRAAQAAMLATPAGGEQSRAAGKEALQAAGAAALASFLEAEAEYGRALSLALAGDAGAQGAVDRAISSFTRAVHSLMTVSDVTAVQQADTAGRGSKGVDRSATPCLTLPPSVPVLDIKDVAALEQAVVAAHALGRAAGVYSSTGLGHAVNKAHTLLDMPSLSSLPLLIGLDSEWTPAISSLEGTQVALLQLAVLPSAALEEHAELAASTDMTLLGARVLPSLGFVLLLDIPALAGEAKEAWARGGWARLNEALTALLAPQAGRKEGSGNGLAAVVLTYGGKTDVSMLHRSYPLLSVFSPMASGPHGGKGKGGGRSRKVQVQEEQHAGLEAADIREETAMAAPDVPAPVRVRGGSSGMVTVDLLDLVKAMGGRLPAMAGEEEGKVLLHEPSVGGLTSLCARLLGASLDKTWQTSLWHRRPLLPQQRQYAALDAWVLPQLVGRMREVLLQAQERQVDS